MKTAAGPQYQNIPQYLMFMGYKNSAVGKFRGHICRMRPLKSFGLEFDIFPLGRCSVGPNASELRGTPLETVSQMDRKSKEAKSGNPGPLFCPNPPLAGRR